MAKRGRMPILDLRALNKYMEAQKVKMIMLAAIIQALEQGDWFSAFDLEVAYFHILI